MELSRRHFTLALAALPAGCAIQPLPALRTETATAPAGTIALRPPALGQRWTYRHINGYNSALLATQEHEVVALAPRVRIRIRSDAGPAEQEEQQQPWGQMWRETGWDDVLNYEQAMPLWPPEPTPGARSVHRTHYRIDNDSFRYWISRHSTVQGWERVTLAGGSLLALRIEHLIRLQHPDFNRIETVRRDTLWLAPETGRWVAREVTGEFLRPGGTRMSVFREDWFRWELVDWR